MFKGIARKPAESRRQYMKYGFVITESQVFACPRCGDPLNAGPAYHPAYCGRCGQKLDFRGVAWEEERFIGYAEERSTGWDTLKNASA